ncbi:eukaryotic peptide chain release factor subunit 1-3 [Tanacetum coccineum]
MSAKGEKIEELRALRDRVDVAKAESASLRATIRTIGAVEMVLRNRIRDERQTRIEIERQLASVQESHHQDREDFKKLKEFMTSSTQWTRNDGIEKDITINFEPFTPISDSLCVLDNWFRTQALAELLESELKYGFIAMVDNKAFFRILSGNRKQVLDEITVDPPMRHIGGSDHEYDILVHFFHKDYLSMVVDLATKWYICYYINISALVVAASPTYKTKLIGRLDLRLQNKVMCTVEVSYGGNPGFDEAIALLSNYLYNVMFVQEKSLLQKFMKEIGEETNKYVFGMEDTLRDVWIRSNFRDAGTNAEMEVLEKTSLKDWFAHGYKEFGCTLEFVIDSSLEGSMFCRALGGIGGILRYRVDIRAFDL